MARIELAAGGYSLRSLLDNQDAVAIAIFQAPGSNALQLSSTVRATMRELGARFPQGVESRIVYDPTINVRDGIREVIKTLLEAVLLVVVVVVLFLQTWRASIIPLVAVPISIVGTFAILLGFGFSMALAAGSSAADPELLPPEQAFRFSARALNDRTLEARFAVADGYYLYREKLKFAIEPAIVGLGVPQLPPGKFKEDQFFGKVETYRGEVVVKLPLPESAAGKAVALVADSQGCADLGVCYPVNRQQVTLVLPAERLAPSPVPSRCG